jgi:NAD(P)-dependent dehydrogenase (short-subunit alcohol dehydrogenase family)
MPCPSAHAVYALCRRGQACVGERGVCASGCLAVSLARELKDSGVTSNAVAPGAILVPSIPELLTSAAPRYG